MTWQWGQACAVASAHASGVGVVNKPTCSASKHFQQFEAHRTPDIFRFVVLRLVGMSEYQKIAHKKPAHI